MAARGHASIPSLQPGVGKRDRVPGMLQASDVLLAEKKLHPMLKKQPASAAGVPPKPWRHARRRRSVFSRTLGPPAREIIHLS